MEEKKYKFDPFKFIRDRAKSVPPTDLDFAYFNNHVCVNIISLHEKYISHALHMNSIAFGRLSKKHQCLAYTSFNGKQFPYKEYISSSLSKSTEDTEKISELFKVSLKEAQEMIDYKTINVEKAIRLYSEIYEPEKLLTKTGNLKKE
jgi:hypothetical protein